MMMTVSKNKILMGVIAAPHGIKGEVRIKSFSDDPLSLSRYQPLYNETGREVKILKLRLDKTKLIAQIDRVTDRNEARELQGTQLFVDRQALDDDLEEDEFYQADLLGFRAVVRDEQGQGEEIGRISGFFNFGAGDLVEVRAESGKSWLIPFSRAAVPVIDKLNQQIEIDEQAAGLIDNEENLTEL